MTGARKVWAMWHGGGNYSVGTYDEHTEVFPSIALAKYAFANRAHTGGHWRQRFVYADGREEHVFTPTVDATTPDEGGPTMHLYFSDPRENADPYPDREICFGKRGGVTISPC